MTAPLTPLHGNHACALAAIAAGCRFFGGYPITPSSEVAERMSRELPRVGGTFIQMEDEIASMAAIIGASMGGTKAMTATSGPGFSLMQEHIGYAAITEVPCVIVNVTRGGPSTGMPTRPAQGDVMQARWGTHGDHPIIVLTPASVQEVYDQTIRAFDMSEKFRVPVVVMYDQILAHLLEGVAMRAPGQVHAGVRKWVAADAQNYLPYAAGADGVPEMARPGDGHRVHTTGLTHAETGFPTQTPAVVERNVWRLLNKLDKHRDEIDAYETAETEDAEILVVSFGISARAARRAVKTLRAGGIRAGLFRPITIWPFPEAALRQAAKGARAVLVPEMNAGQLAVEIERILRDGTPVISQGKIDGQPITPDEIVARAKEL